MLQNLMVSSLDFVFSSFGLHCVLNLDQDITRAFVFLKGKLDVFVLSLKKATDRALVNIGIIDGMDTICLPYCGPNLNWDPYSLYLI